MTNHVWRYKTPLCVILYIPATNLSSSTLIGVDTCKAYFFLLDITYEYCDGVKNA